MALEFNGSTNYVDCGFRMVAQDEITILTWVKILGAGGVDQRLVGQRGGGAANSCFLLYYDHPNERIIFYATNALGTDYTYNDAIGSINDNQWHFLAMSFKRNDFRKTYRDGSELDSAATADSPLKAPAANNVTIGKAHNDTAAYLHGVLADMRLYNKQLSADEIESVRQGNGNDNIYPENLLFRYLMNEDTDGQAAAGAGSVIDIGKVGNHGTATNNPLYRASELKLIRSHYQ